MIIKQIIHEAIHDGWAQAGVIGAIVTGCTKWLLTIFGDTVGNITYIGGAVVVVLVIIEKSIGVISKYRQLKKRDKRQRYEDDLEEWDKQD